MEGLSTVPELSGSELGMRSWSFVESVMVHIAPESFAPAVLSGRRSRPRRVEMKKGPRQPSMALRYTKIPAVPGNAWTTQGYKLFILCLAYPAVKVFTWSMMS